VPLLACKQCISGSSTSTAGQASSGTRVVQRNGTVITLQPHPEGTILPVRAQPGARRNEIRGEQDGMLKVCVTQSPEKGKANKAVIELMAKSLGLRKSQIELLSGETSHQKRLLIRSITPEELAQKLAEKMN
jgi:hypothetical protein